MYYLPLEHAESVAAVIWALRNVSSCEGCALGTACASKNLTLCMSIADKFELMFLAGQAPYEQDKGTVPKEDPWGDVVALLGFEVDSAAGNELVPLPKVSGTKTGRIPKPVNPPLQSVPLSTGAKKPDVPKNEAEARREAFKVILGGKK